MPREDRIFLHGVGDEIETMVALAKRVGFRYTPWEEGIRAFIRKILSRIRLHILIYKIHFIFPWS